MTRIYSQKGDASNTGDPVPAPTADQVLATDGSANYVFLDKDAAEINHGKFTDGGFRSSMYTANPSEVITYNLTSSFTINAPASPATGDWFMIRNNSSVKTEQLTISGNGNNIENPLAYDSGLIASHVLDARATRPFACRWGFFSSGWRVLSSSVATESGSYVPTATDGANVTSSGGFSGKFYRINNLVHVAVEGFVNPTASGTETSLRLTLPIASNFTASEDAIGSGARDTTGVDGGEAIRCVADSANDEVDLIFNATTLNSLNFAATFMYEIK